MNKTLCANCDHETETNADGDCRYCGNPHDKKTVPIHYVVELDGDKWFAHYNNFTNLMESDEYAFGDTPQQALQNLITSRVEHMNRGGHISSEEFSGQIGESKS